MSNRSRKVVPASREALNQMKYEIAAELGLTNGTITQDRFGMTEFASELGGTEASSAPGSVQWSKLATRDAGSVGGLMTRQLIQRAEEVLKGL
ncbi:small, acid-soluble spore protein, alpha/beta type [Paenibacillus solisilvae]|uniref:Small, acid-soluble spore protein, alpha/beta type n=1 Tax=Paenibacillus solisilvae TaxID=2486751 RepID=A0ABW0W4U0_9BACL